MEIDFIKRAIQDAEDYQITEDGGVFCISEQQSLTFIEDLKEGFPVHYRDILQSAIEGINKQSYFGNSQIEIIQHRWGIQIKDYSTDNHDKKHFRFESYENYKEESLKYIYDQEKKDLTTKQS